MRKFIICAIVKDEHSFIEEWVNYYLSIGFDKIYIYEDYGSGSHVSLLEKYINKGVVEIHSLEQEKIIPQGYTNGHHTQIELYNWFFNKCKTKEIKADWVGFFDIDEFLVFNNGYDLNKLTSEFREYPGIWVSWRIFGANGYIHRPEGKVMDNYLKYEPINHYVDGTMWNHKSLVNVEKANKLLNHHSVEGGVHTNLKGDLNGDQCWDKCCLNHYFIKSWDDYKYRMQKRGNMNNNRRSYDNFFEFSPEFEPMRMELLKEVQSSKVNGVFWISRKERIIAGGNMNRLRPTIQKTNNQYFTTNLQIHKKKYITLDNYAIVLVSKCGSSTIATQSLIRSGHKNFLGDWGLEYFVYNNLFSPFSDPWPYIDKHCKKNEDELTDKKKVAIYRDPIERVISAKHVISPHSSMQEYLDKVVKTLNECKSDEYDQHIAPQYLFYDANTIDIFVNIKDLQGFLEKIGFPTLSLNQRTSIEKKHMKEDWEGLKKKYEPILKELYKKDYELINNIPQEKKWNLT